MTFISRAFHGRPRDQGQADRLPPGQYRVRDFPVLSAGPTPRTPLTDWTFSITGEVDKLKNWTWDEFRKLPTETITRDIVPGDRLGRQLAELVPRPILELIDFAGDRKRPIGKRRARGGSRGQDREVSHAILSGRQTVCLALVAGPTVEGARNEGHNRNISVTLIVLPRCRQTASEFSTYYPSATLSTA